MSKLSLQVWPSVLIWLLLCPAASIRGLQAPPLNATEPGYSPAEEEMARALAQQQRAAAGRARLAKYRAEDGADPPTITVGICNQLAGEVGAAGCSLITAVSGVAEGCECKIIGKDTCAFPDLVKQPPFQITGRRRFHLIRRVGPSFFARISSG